MLIPKLLTTLKGYTPGQLVRDLTAGVIVGVVALPLAIAFAIASGVTPDRGLYTAIVCGFLISALGGSRVQIGGPTGAFVVIVYGIVQQHGVDGLLVATMMAGLMLVGFGLARFGALIKFIPFPVTIGFTSGIAVLILSSQVKDFLGLEMGDVPTEFLLKWRAYWSAIDSIDPTTVAVAIGAFLILVLWPRLTKRIPAPLIALVGATIIVTVFDLPVETVGDRFGDIRATLPRPSLPSFQLSSIPELIPSAFVIAILGAIESLLSAVVADGMIGGRHRSNMELVAQGVANVVGPLFGAIPATGAIARTATNVKSGGRTPVAGIMHAITLLVITIFLGRWVALIPFAALAAILVLVSYHMSEWRSVLNELRSPKSDIIVLLTTFTLTVVVDLTVAIQVGMVLAALLFMKRMAEVSEVVVLKSEISDQIETGVDRNAIYRRSVPDGVVVYEINGPFFFGAADRFRTVLSSVSDTPKVLIVRMRNVPAMDSTGLRALGEVVRRSLKDGIVVLFSNVLPQPLSVMRKAGLVDLVGSQNVLDNVDDALNAARVHLAASGSSGESVTLDSSGGRAESDGGEEPPGPRG